MNFLFKLFENWVAPFQRAPAALPANSPYAFLFFFVKQMRWPFVLMLVLGGLTAIIEASLYTFLGDIVDMLDQGQIHEFFASNGTVLLAMAAVVLVARTLVTLLTALVEEQTVVPAFFNLVRWQCHQAVMDQSLSFFNDDFSGRISQKVWQAGQAAGDFMTTLLQTVWYIFVYAIATLVLVSDLDWRLGVLVALWLGFFCWIAAYFVPRVRHRAKTMANAGSIVTGRLVDTYTNIQTVKLFSNRTSENRGVRSAYDGFLDKLREFTRTLTAVRAIMSLLSGTAIVLIAGTAIWLWQTGDTSVGHVAFTLGLVLRLNLLLNRMLGQLNALFRSLGTLQDSMELIARPVQLVDAPDAGALAVKEGRISFEKIRFHYGKSRGVIDDLSLSIRGGERVGIVGPSGAGKTTLVSLLLRFYDLEGGRIRIDGQDVSQVTQQSLRDSIGLVTQDTSLLHRSIRENIVYGRPQASEGMMRQAARDAHALEFIETLVDQKGRHAFEAQVGERGVKLSGGQRQRISIARVLLKDAPILVLDEATSALDSEIENAIQENLQRMMNGKTVIAIAHRLSTIAAMDRLVVMHKGEIVQEGTHEQLLRDTGGLYYQLWQRQSLGFLGEDAEYSAA
ncbi:ABC transporter ATP-binding protein [Roseibium sp. RKSG952]|uniref:ABC transporter ATP-binding protein n=1 Tax=Roseibium sp. RKSG952 TaxID=2529384 RepID=UPI0012BB564C|nr:ABC transporter ATP-binding protein [Roseibium sp. RKSG952]MTH98410.1 ABC transporter ATP-binding protein [Roseibium sp. RKSG952]